MASVVLGTLSKRTGHLAAGLRWVAVGVTLAAVILLLQKWAQVTRSRHEVRALALEVAQP
jgi:hypothetical protein